MKLQSLFQDISFNGQKIAKKALFAKKVTSKIPREALTAITFDGFPVPRSLVAFILALYWVKGRNLSNEVLKMCPAICICRKCEESQGTAKKKPKTRSIRIFQIKFTSDRILKRIAFKDHQTSFQLDLVF